MREQGHNRLPYQREAAAAAEYRNMFREHVDFWKHCAQGEDNYTQINTTRTITRLEALLKKREGINIIVPGGNTTLLLESPHFSERDLPSIAKLVMKEGLAEQCGLAKHNPRHGEHTLLMPSGEFCLNGVRALAALLHSRKVKESPWHISCSGKDDLVECRSQDWPNDLLRSEVTLNIKPIIVPLREGLVLIHMQGISHFLCTVPDPYMLNCTMPQDLKTLEKQFGKDIRESQAVGAIFYSKGERGFRIKPIVRTVAYMEETGCASGSALLAWYQHYLDGKNECMQIEQPCGEQYHIEIEGVEEDTSSFRVKLASPVLVQHDWQSQSSPDKEIPKQ